MSSDDRIVIDRERFDRTLNALALVSQSDFEAAAKFLGPVEEDDFGELEAVLELSVADLSAATAAQKRAQETVADQRRSLETLSAPILDIWDGVIVMPMIGNLDSHRVAVMTEKLLDRLAASNARFAILDATGVDIIDTSSASDLVRMADAARLLGSRCVMTGIGAELANTLSTLNLTLGGIPTLRTLREGLRYCLQHVDNDKKR